MRLHTGSTVYLSVWQWHKANSQNDAFRGTVFTRPLLMTETLICYTSFVLRYWPYGSEGCQTHGFHGFVTALASIHFIAAIAWDRYHQYCTSKSTPASFFAQQLTHTAIKTKSILFSLPQGADSAPCSTHIHTCSQQVFVLCLQLILRPLAILERQLVSKWPVV